MRANLKSAPAGNMLGQEQSGQITAVGFDLYCQLLKQSVAALKGEKVKPRVEVQVRFDFLALNPAEEGAGALPMAPKEPANGHQGRSRAASVEINVPREVATYVLPSESDSEKIRNPESKIRNWKGFGVYTALSTFRGAAADCCLSQAGAGDGEGRAGTVGNGIAGPVRDACRRRWNCCCCALGGELKILAGEKGHHRAGGEGGFRLMLTRNNDFIMLGGKFPAPDKNRGARTVEGDQAVVARRCE